MMRIVKHIFLAVLIAAGMLFNFTDESPAATEKPQMGIIDTNGVIRVGDQAPAIEGVSLEGAAVTAASLRGRPILMDFSSIFCGSCQETIREFSRLQNVYRDTDLALVMVVDGAAPIETMINFFGQMEAEYTVIRDKEYRLFESYGVKTIPFQVTIGRAGKIQKIHVGFDPELDKTLNIRDLIRK